MTVYLSLDAIVYRVQKKVKAIRADAYRRGSYGKFRVWCGLKGTCSLGLSRQPEFINTVTKRGSAVLLSKGSLLHVSMEGSAGNN